VGGHAILVVAEGESHGSPTGAAAVFMMRSTTAPSANTSRSLLILRAELLEVGLMIDFPRPDDDPIFGGTKETK